MTDSFSFIGTASLSSSHAVFLSHGDGLVAALSLTRLPSKRACFYRPSTRPRSKESSC
jgi:hypothetical protein